MMETCCNCFAGRVIKKVCDNCGHSFKRQANDHTPRRAKFVGERLPNQKEQNEMRKAVYRNTGADPFNTPISGRG